MMKKKLLFAIFIALSLCSYGQCVKVSDGADANINGNYSKLETENFYGYAVYGHSNGEYYLHRDEDNWYINKDKDSPDDGTVAFCTSESETVPTEGWKTIDGSSPPNIATGCE